jgi:NAD-dependent DNA ligase
VQRVGEPPAELDYEIDGIVIKVDASTSSAARRAARAAALGACVQVGADDAP